MAEKRITKDIQELSRVTNTEWSLAPVGDDLFHWKANLRGPRASPYAGGVFILDIKLPNDYPFSPPTVQFQTMYHMNVRVTGSICMNILSDEWSPELSLAKIMMTISALLEIPNPDDPALLRGDLADLYKTDREAYNKKIREWTQKNAM